MNRALIGLALGSFVTLALGASGCVCVVQGQGTASGQASGTPTAAAPPTTARPTPPVATTPVPAPQPQLPVIKGGGVFGDDKQHPDALRGLVFYLPEGTNKLPDFNALKPVGVLYTRQLNISPRRFDAGFPGIDNRFEWFGIRYDGTFRVAKDGEYHWHVVSDDGSIVWVDGQIVINNDGVHPPVSKEAKITLKAGAHSIRVDYFQGPRWDIALQLWVTAPGGQEQLWSASF